MKKVPVKLRKKANNLGLEHIQRHMFLCGGGGNCCDDDTARASWKYLKRRLKTLGLSLPDGYVQRSVSKCLGLCVRGPIAVVYPDGVWYHSCTPEVIEQIIQTHLIGGEVLNSYAILPPQQPLGSRRLPVLQHLEVTQ